MYAQGKEDEADSHYDALQAVLSAIPEELYHEVELDISAAEGAATNKQRLEVLREQQELIEQEAAQSGEQSMDEKVKDDRDIDEKDDNTKVESEASAKTKWGEMGRCMYETSVLPMYITEDTRHLIFLGTFFRFLSEGIDIYW